jgi:hypothetical protein
LGGHGPAPVRAQAPATDGATALGVADTQRIPLLEIAIAEPGPVELALPPALAPWLIDDRLLIEDPTGDRTFAKVQLAHHGAPIWIGGEVVSATRDPGGQRIVVDLGARSIEAHDRLRIALGERISVTDIVLEASADRVDWKRLTRGSLFAAGSSGDMRIEEIRYAPTSARYLRLTWPVDAPAPAWRAIEARTLDGDGPEARSLTWHTMTPKHKSERPSLTSFWLLRLPPTGQTNASLDLEWTSDAALTNARLHTLQADRSRPLAAAVGKESLTLDGLSLTAGTRDLRLDLSSADGRSPQLSDATLFGDARVVRWVARVAGRHRIAVSLDEPESWENVDMDPPSAGDFRAVEGGRMLAPVRLVLPAALRPAGVASPDQEPTQHWDLAGDSEIAPGTLVALSLPPAVGDLRDPGSRLRLLSGDRQLPYAVDRTGSGDLWLAGQWSPVTGAEGAEGAGSSRSAQGVAQSSIELPLPAGWPRQRGLELELLATEGPFERSVTLSVEDGAAPIGAQARKVLERFTWRCPAPRELACMHRIRLPALRQAGTADTLRLTFDDGDNPPLDDVELRLWADLTRLVFVWPDAVGSSSPRLSLAAYAPPLAAPRYDLAPLLARWGAMAADDLDLRLVDDSSEPDEDGPPTWLLAVALAAATLALLWVLARVMREDGANGG